MTPAIAHDRRGSAAESPAPEQAPTGRQRPASRAATAFALADTSPGRPLAPRVEAGLAREVGGGLGAVRVHDDEAGGRLADGLGAAAFARGTHVYFAPGQYAPDTAAGRRLLGHEVGHVVQQDRGEAAAFAGQVVPHDHPTEAAATDAYALAPPTARSGTAIQRQPKGTQPPPPQPPQQKLADDESRRFDSTYNKVVINYTHLGSQQHDAIDSIYTEAKKPTPPSLAVEILIALATAALGIPISLLGQKLEQAALKWLLPKVADPAQTTNAVLKASAQKATDAVKMFAKAANDALKDGVKALVGPYVRKNITDGKLPIDAFFEGLKQASTDNAMKGSNAAEDNREPIRGLGTVDPALPQAIANVLLEAQTETFATAYDMQREQTLRQWLDYQAQAAVGSVGGPTPGHDDPSVIDLHALDPNRVRHADTAGIVFVDAYIGDTGGLFARSARIPGLSKSMLKLIEKTFVKDLGLPIVYRVVSMRDRDGKGVNQPAGSFTPEADQFSVMVNEAGGIATSRLYRWHEQALQRIAHPGMDGPYSVHTELGYNRPIDLHVEADKD